MTTLRKLDLNLLKVLDAVLAERSVSKAATRLSLSQPAISNSLNRLRVALDDPLFVRTAEGMAPTPRAREIAEPLRQALELIGECVARQPHFDHATAERDFVIAAEDYGEAVILPRLTDWLSRTAPGLRVCIRPERGYALKTELREGEVDFAIDYFPLREDDFDNLPLMSDKLVTIMRRDHPLAAGPLTLEGYVSAPHVVMAQKGGRTALVDRALARAGLSRNRSVVVPHFLTMPLVASRSDHLATLPRRIAWLFAEHFPLVVTETPLDIGDVPIFLAWGRMLTDNAAHCWLRSSILRLSQEL